MAQTVFHERLPGLEERPRPGRPRAFPPEVVVQVKALACELPANLGLPLSRMSIADVAREVRRAGIVASRRAPQVSQISEPVP